MYNQCCSVIPFFWNTSCLQTSCYIHFHLKKYLNKRVLNAAMDGIPLFWKQSIVIDKFCETYFFRGRVHFYSYTANLATEMQFKPLTLTCYVLWFLEYWHTNCRTEGCLMWIPQINIWLHSPLLFHCLFPFISSYTPSPWPLPPLFCVSILMAVTHCELYYRERRNLVLVAPLTMHYTQSHVHVWIFFLYSVFLWLHNVWGSPQRCGVCVCACFLIVFCKKY